MLSSQELTNELSECEVLLQVLEGKKQQLAEVGQTEAVQEVTALQQLHEELKEQTELQNARLQQAVSLRQHYNTGNDCTSRSKPPRSRSERLGLS